MTEVTLQLEDAVALFYRRIAAAKGFPLEQVLCDALFKLAGLDEPGNVGVDSCGQRAGDGGDHV